MKSWSTKNQWRFNHYLSLALIALIFLGINFVGYKKAFRKDFSVNRFLTLSPQSINLLNNLKDDVHIIQFLSSDSDQVTPLIYEHLQYLLKEYRHRSGGKISISEVHPFVDVQKAEQIARKFKLMSNENVLILEKGEAFKTVKMADLAEVDFSGAFFNQPPRISSFKGELILTGALMELIEGKRHKIYFTTGHGEPNPDANENSPADISRLASRLKAQNFDWETVNLSDTGYVPEDASALVVIGPRSAFTPQEILILSEYIKNGGRTLIALNPTYHSGLETIFSNYGVSFQKNIVLKNVLTLVRGGLTGAISSDAVASRFSSHPSVSWLQKFGGNLNLGLAQSISINRLTTGEPSPDVISLMETGSKDWGETDLASIEAGKPDLNPEADQVGPLTLAVAIQQGAVAGTTVTQEGMRVIAVGASEFLTNQSIGAVHSDFFVNSLHWLVGRTFSLDIAPRVPQEFNITITGAQKSKIALAVLIILPATALLIGFIVWFKRRK